jgi:hypothetical protein
LIGGILLGFIGGEKKRQRIAGIKTVFRRHCVMPSPNVPVDARRRKS